MCDSKGVNHYKRSQTYIPGKREVHAKIVTQMYDKKQVGYGQYGSLDSKPSLS